MSATNLKVVPSRQPTLVESENIFKSALVEAALKTLDVQCSTRAVLKQSSLVSASEIPPASLASIIGITGSDLTGNVACLFSKELFLHLMSGMFGEAISDITPEIEPGAGEILNIIFGNAKAQLNKHGFGFEQATPVVIRSSDMKVSFWNTGISTLVSFNIEKMPWHLLFSLKPKQKGS